MLHARLGSESVAYVNSFSSHMNPPYEMANVIAPVTGWEMEAHRG